MTEYRATITILSEAKIRFKSDGNVEKLVYDKFSYEVPGKMWIPSVKSGMWDGVIRMYKNDVMPSGLITKLMELLDAHGISYNVVLAYKPAKAKVDIKDLDKITFGDGKGGLLTPYDFQDRAIKIGVEKKKILILSPTGSGKSLIICALFRLYEKVSDKKILVIFPRIGLVNQTYENIKEYGQSVENIQKISSKEKVDKLNIDKQIVFTTWQSIYKMPKKWFEDYGMVIGDEAHRFESKSLGTIMDNLINAEYRIGLTGSTKGDKINEITLESLFGPIIRVAETHELQDRGILSQMKIVQIYYKTETELQKKKLSYQEEIDVITGSHKRNVFLKNLSNSLNGNTLILFRYNDKHGLPLYDCIKKLECSSYFISGGIHPDEREKIRKLIEKEKKSITVASIGTFSEGIDIKNIHNIILAHPVKGKVQVIQSIGRGLRIADNKEPLVIYDIVDVIEGLTNSIVIKHARIRESLYKAEKFVFKKYTP